MPDPESSVPLSAIRALVQQWRERKFGGPPYSECGRELLMEIEHMATEVEALCLTSGDAEIIKENGKPSGGQ